MTRERTSSALSRRRGRGPVRQELRDRGARLRKGAHALDVDVHGRGKGCVALPSIGHRLRVRRWDHDLLGPWRGPLVRSVCGRSGHRRPRQQVFHVRRPASDVGERLETAGFDQLSQQTPVEARHGGGHCRAAHRRQRLLEVGAKALRADAVPQLIQDHPSLQAVPQRPQRIALGQVEHAEAIPDARAQPQAPVVLVDPREEASQRLPHCFRALPRRWCRSGTARPTHEEDVRSLGGTPP